MTSYKGKTLIIGALGQVGRAIFKASKYKYEVLEHDLRKGHNKRGESYDLEVDPSTAQGLVMHFCIPFTKDFPQIISEYHKTFNPSLVILHASLPPGTTKGLSEKGLPVVHSPVIFDDNRLSTVSHFRKMIGYDNSELALKAEAHIRLCFNTALIKGSINTELADICLGLYNMTCRSITFEIARMFSLYGCDYRVMMEFLGFNNIGYATINKPDLMLQNMYPDLNKADYRLGLTELLPEKLCSAFFKLAKRSYTLEGAK